MANKFLIKISENITAYSILTGEQIFTGKLIDFKETSKTCSTCKHERQLQFWTADPCKWCDKLNPIGDDRVVKGQQKDMWEENINGIQ